MVLFHATSTAPAAKALDAIVNFVSNSQEYRASKAMMNAGIAEAQHASFVALGRAGPKAPEDRVRRALVNRDVR